MIQLLTPEFQPSHMFELVGNLRIYSQATTLPPEKYTDYEVGNVFLF